MLFILCEAMGNLLHPSRADPPQLGVRPRPPSPLPPPPSLWLHLKQSPLKDTNLEKIRVQTRALQWVFNTKTYAKKLRLGKSSGGRGAWPSRTQLMQKLPQAITLAEQSICIM